MSGASLAANDSVESLEVSPPVKVTISTIKTDVALATATHGYEKGGEDYSDLQSEAQEREFDIIIQGAKVVDLLRQAQEAIDVLAGMADDEE